jgi:hypothetical protein
VTQESRVHVTVLVISEPGWCPAMKMMDVTNKDACRKTQMPAASCFARTIGLFIGLHPFIDQGLNVLSSCGCMHLQLR